MVDCHNNNHLWKDDHDNNVCKFCGHTIDNCWTKYEKHIGKKNVN